MTKISRYRWVVLGVFSLSAGLSQFLWLNFAPLVTWVEKQYSVPEDQAGLLLLVFPLIYIFLSLPAGALIDRKGYVYSVGLGSVVMAVFSCLRIFEGSFWLLVLAQSGIAVAQPFVVNGVSKLVLDWFPREQDALANGFATMGMFLGMAAGMAGTPMAMEAWGYRGTMLCFAAVSIAVAVAFIALAREAKAGTEHAKSGMAGTEHAVSAGISREEFRILLGNQSLRLVFGLAFLGLGFFNGLTTWIEPILAPQGVNSVQAGVVGGMLVIGGIVGAAVLPGFSDYFRRHKPFLVFSIFAALGTLFPLCFSSDYHSLILLGGLQGFFFLPAFALLLAMCSELAGQSYAGAATGILMLAGNAGAVFVIIAMEWVNRFGSGHDFVPAVYLMGAILGFALVCSLFLEETHPARRE